MIDYDSMSYKVLHHKDSHDYREKINIIQQLWVGHGTFTDTET